jgi:hypothetical protein
MSQWSFTLAAWSQDSYWHIDTLNNKNKFHTYKSSMTEEMYIRRLVCVEDLVLIVTGLCKICNNIVYFSAMHEKSWPKRNLFMLCDIFVERENVYRVQHVDKQLYPHYLVGSCEMVMNLQVP